MKIIPFYGDVSLSLVCFDNLDNSKCECPRVYPPWAHRSYATEDWSVRAVTISQETTYHYKGAVNTLAHKKDAMTSCPLSIFSNFTGIISLALIKIFPCFYNVQLINGFSWHSKSWIGPLKAICLIHHNHAKTKTSQFHKNFAKFQIFQSCSNLKTPNLTTLTFEFNELAINW